jgi:hypothetical protein
MQTMDARRQLPLLIVEGANSAGKRPDAAIQDTGTPLRPQGENDAWPKVFDVCRRTCELTNVRHLSSASERTAGERGIWLA